MSQFRSIAIIVVWARNLETGQVNGFVIEKGPQGVPGFSAKKIENKNSLRIVQKYARFLSFCCSS